MPMEHPLGSDPFDLACAYLRLHLEGRFAVVSHGERACADNLSDAGLKSKRISRRRSTAAPLASPPEEDESASKQLGWSSSGNLSVDATVRGAEDDPPFWGEEGRGLVDVIPSSGHRHGPPCRRGRVGTSFFYLITVLVYNSH